MINYIKYPTTIKVLIAEINRACDDYISRKISDAELKSLIIAWANSSGDKLFAGSSALNPTVIQRCGKKRIQLIEKMLVDFQSKLFF
ncbi:MAG: TIGR04540 family protein [Pelosinus sp.]|nr:TIGR04540 family protein [Pelosinus sp.]